MNLRQKIACNLLLYVVFYSFLFVSNSWGDIKPSPAVHIPDTNLEQAIREELVLPPELEITERRITKLRTLNAENRGIKDLTGLEHATALNELSISFNPVSDLSPLATLKWLKFLHASECNIVDLTPLANLTSLIELHLNGNQISDVAPLQNLKRLRRLEIDDNPVADCKTDELCDRVDIPDKNLLAAIQEILEIDIPIITQADMLQLENLTSPGRGIANLTGLEYAANLQRAWLYSNLIENLEPLANLTKLELLALGQNRIRDVSPLANLHNLESLSIEQNRIVDHSSLHALTLSDFTYDQSCELPPEPLEPRLENRSFPSVHAWFSTAIRNRPNLGRTVDLPHHNDWLQDRIAEGSQHDLYATGAIFGDHFLEVDNEIWLRANIEGAIRHRDDFRSLNPSMIFLLGIAMWDAGGDHFPEGSPYWARDPNGKRIPKGRLYLINWSHPEVQDIIVEQAIAVSRCGLYDGVFFDRWREDVYTLRQYVSHEEEVAIRVDILRRIRMATRPDFLIMVNSNNQPIPRTAQYVNGNFMETKLPFQVTKEDILERRVAYSRDTMEWLQQNVREPHIVAIEGTAIPAESEESPENRRWMRVMTTMSLTNSDGCTLYSYGGDTGRYTWWYDFWDADLGRPVSPKLQFYNNVEKLYIREFTNGWAVYNQSGEAQIVTLPEEVHSVAGGLVNVEHSVPNFDGDIFLRTASKEPADLNGDGIVNILDLTIIVQAFGTNDSAADVNGDGLVNVFDLVFVANRF